MLTQKRYLRLLSQSLLLVLICLACRQEDKDFPIPPAYKGFNFSLSNDSIIMDTIPSEYLSATYNIRLYNPNKEAITLKSIKLLGQSKGFSINVDGSFGKSFENVHVNERDSIYIFARAFLPLGKEDKATEVKDLIEITDDKGKVYQMPIIAIRQNVEHIKALTIEQDLRRSSERPWLVHDSIVVGPGAKLRLESPAQIWFRSNAYMRVEGELEIEGRAERPVRFCATRWDKFLPLVPYSRLSGQWGGIFFGEEAKARLSYFHLINASYGLHFAPNKGANQRHAIADIQHCKISNIKGVGLKADIGYFRISDSEISNTLGSCLALSGGRYDIQRSSIINYYPWPDIRSDKALVYQDLSQSKSLESFQNQASYLHIDNSIVDGEMPVYHYSYNNSQKGGEIQLTILSTQTPQAIIKFNHCYLRSIHFPKNEYYELNDVLFRDKKTKTKDLYRYLGENKKKKKDYRFDFRPKEGVPFIGLGTDGSGFTDLDGKPREEKMTYGAYRKN